MQAIKSPARCSKDITILSCIYCFPYFLHVLCIHPCFVGCNIEMHVDWIDNYLKLFNQCCHYVTCSNNMFCVNMPTDYSRGRYIQLKDYAGRHTPILLSAYFRCLTHITNWFACDVQPAVLKHWSHQAQGSSTHCPTQFKASSYKNLRPLIHNQLIRTIKVVSSSANS